MVGIRSKKWDSRNCKGYITLGERRYIYNYHGKSTKAKRDCAKTARRNAKNYIRITVANMGADMVLDEDVITSQEMNEWQEFLLDMMVDCN